jgi:hypothetical protein
MSYPDCPAWGEEAVEHLIGETVPPGEEKRGFDDRMLFIETLVLAIALKEEGKMLLEALRKKWRPEVETSMQEAVEMANKLSLND